MWFGPSKEEKEMMMLHKSIAELQQSVKLMVNSMKTSQESLTQQSDNINQIVLNTGYNRVSTFTWFTDYNKVSMFTWFTDHNRVSTFTWFTDPNRVSTFTWFTDHNRVSTTE